MPTLSDAAAVTLTRGFQIKLNRVAARAGTVSKRSFLGLSGWDRSNIAEFIEAVTPALNAAGGASLMLSMGFYKLLADESAAGISSLVTAPNYEAPFTAYWSSLKDNDWSDAIGSGADRAMSIGSDYVTQVSREVATVASPNATGFRRVPRREACQWCLTVATQRYHTAESANFGHDYCGCLVVPIEGGFDPGQIINRKYRIKDGQVVRRQYREGQIIDPVYRDEIELPTE